MSNTDLNQNPAKTPGNGVSGPQDTWDATEAKESLLLMTDSERASLIGEHLGRQAFLEHTLPWINFGAEWGDTNYKERGQLNAKLCRVNDPDCEACQ